MSWGKGISVAGAHGKTTTSSMLGQVFEECHQDPTIVIGGEVDYLHSNSILGKGAYVIAEADESDGTFLKQNPYIAVVTNIDADHMDHYARWKTSSPRSSSSSRSSTLKKAWPSCALKTTRSAPWPRRRAAATYLTASNSRRTIRPATCITSRASSISPSISTAKDGGYVLNVPGRHNVLNALATTAVADACGLPFDGIASAMSHFHGAKRRFQTKGFVGDVWVVDDYAHHPTEINATLTAARDMGTHRVVCLFQPHRYTRTKLLLDQYGSAFAKADKLIVTDVYSAGEDPIPGVSGELIAKKVKETTGQDVTYIPHKEDLVAYLKENSRPLDLVITMGAGDIYKVGEAYLAEAKEMEK